MRIKDLIYELVKEDIDSEIYAVYEDDDGNKRYFSMDGIALKGFYPKTENEYGHAPDYPTIVLDDA